MIERFCFLQLTAETKTNPSIFFYSAQTKNLYPLKFSKNTSYEIDPLGRSGITYRSGACRIPIQKVIRRMVCVATVRYTFTVAMKNTVVLQTLQITQCWYKCTMVMMGKNLRGNQKLGEKMRNMS